MPRPRNRTEVLKRLRQCLASDQLIVGAGAGKSCLLMCYEHTDGYSNYWPGIGLSAKFVEKGGADLIIVYNSGRFRMAGRGSLAGMMPYGDANAIVLEMVNSESHRFYFLGFNQLSTHMSTLQGRRSSPHYR